MKKVFIFSSPTMGQTHQKIFSGKNSITQAMAFK